MYTLKTKRFDIKLWANPEEVEPQAMHQIHNLAKIDVVKGISVMSDVHKGYGATIGSVVATEGAVMPGAVGSDPGLSRDRGMFCH